MSRVNNIKNGDGDNPFVIVNPYQHPSHHTSCSQYEKNECPYDNFKQAICI